MKKYASFRPSLYGQSSTGIGFSLEIELLSTVDIC